MQYVAASVARPRGQDVDSMLTKLWQVSRKSKDVPALQNQKKVQGFSLGYSNKAIDPVCRPLRVK